MSGLLLISALCFAVFFIFVVSIGMIIAIVELIAGVTIGQWPEKINAFFKRCGWSSDINHQI